MIRYIKPKETNGIAPKFIIKLENNQISILWDAKSTEYLNYVAWVNQGNEAEPFENIPEQFKGN